jgi:hypothetical protein
LLTFDLSVRINDEKFAFNGNTGYILKPYFMRSNNAFNPLDISTFPTIMAKKYTITLITARDLFDTYQNNTSGIDPYIVIKTRGVPSDHRTEKSAIVHNNGFCPRWNEEKVFIINIPELAFISFIVWDKGRISIRKGIDNKRHFEDQK